MQDVSAVTPRVESVISEPVIAAVAAHAASSVAGVVRLEPGVAGLLTSFARVARQRIKGLDPAPVEGVRVRIDPVADAEPAVRLEIDLVVSGLDQATAVAQAVQRAVTRAVTASTGITPEAVSVSILDIDRAGLRA